METIFRVYYVTPLQGAISEGHPAQGGARFQRWKSKKRQENANAPAFLHQAAYSQKNLRKSATSADKKCLLSIAERLPAPSMRE
jgi:hypothetical protein